MKLYTLCIAATATCLTSLAIAGGPDHYAPMHRWSIDATMLGGWSYASAHGKNFTIGVPGTNTYVAFTGNGSEMLAQLGASYDNFSFGASFDLNDTKINGSRNLAGQEQTIQDLTSIGVYAAYKFIRYHRHSVSVIGTLAGTEWDIRLKEIPRNNNTYTAAREGVSESIGFRYQYQWLHHLAVLGQLSTGFHQLNTTLTSSNERLRFAGNSAVTTSFLAGVQYSFDM